MGPVIGRSQAQKQWAALPDHLKRREAAPIGAQQFGDPQRYIMAGVAPGWYNPALDNQKQLEKLQAVEAEKQQERVDKLNPPQVDTRRFGAGIHPNTLFQSDLQGLLTALTRGQQAAQQNVQQNVQNSPQRGEFSPEIQAIRNQFVQSLL